MELLEDTEQVAEQRGSSDRARAFCWMGTWTLRVRKISLEPPADPWQPPEAYRRGPRMLWEESIRTWNALFENPIREESERGICTTADFTCAPEPLVQVWDLSPASGPLVFLTGRSALSSTAEHFITGSLSRTTE